VRIIRSRPGPLIPAGAAALVLGLWLASACGGAGGAHPAPTSARSAPAPTPPRAVWVLSPLGLNVHLTPAASGSRVEVAPQGTRLDVAGSRTVGSERWLQVVATDSGERGWVLDRPDLVIDRQVSLHVDQTSGYSVLFPSGWSVETSGATTTFTGPDAGMLIQTSDDPSRLLATPITPGKELGAQGPIEVYGVTTYLTLYRRNGGGFEYDVKVRFPKTGVGYLFEFEQRQGSRPDPGLFEQLLDSVSVPGEV
jgi:hypothetical protein